MPVLAHKKERSHSTKIEIHLIDSLKIIKSKLGENLLLSYHKNQCLKGVLVSGVDLLNICYMATEFCYLTVYFTFQIHPSPVSSGECHRMSRGRPRFIRPSGTQRLPTHGPWVHTSL